MFGFYAYGVSLGMDIRELAKIINTPQGRAISKLCEGNVLNGQMGTFSALQAIDKLEGRNLYRDLHQYDTLPLMMSDEGSESLSPVIFENTRYTGAYDIVTRLVSDYFTKNVRENPNALTTLNKHHFANKKKGKVDLSQILTNMLYQIALLGKTDECINTITSSENKSLKEFSAQFPKLSNASDFEASLYQLLEHCKKYGNLVTTYHEGTLASDLKILAQGAEEMRVLGSILSSNKGVKSKTEEGLNFIDTIENCINNRIKIMGGVPSPNYKIDFTLFCIDPEYRSSCIERYEEVKHSINILDVVATAPHFLSYLRACTIPNAAFKVGSLKFRTRNKYYDQMISSLEITRSKDKEGVARGIESAVNFRMLREWLANEQLKFILPAGNRLFIESNGDSIITTEDTPVLLSSDTGLATFKTYMETVIIPKLKANPGYSRNRFIQGLIPFELTKTGTHAAVSAYTLEGNMMPYTESQEIQMENYRADFDSLYGMRFPGANTPGINSITNYADAFYIYSQYVFGGRKGQKSLMAFFDNDDCILTKHFREFEAALDANADYNFDTAELIPWCAPVGNIHHPSTKFFWANPKNQFGKVLMTQAQETVGDEESTTTKTVIKPVDAAMNADARQNFLNPLLYNGNRDESIYKMGQNLHMRYFNGRLHGKIDPDLNEEAEVIENEYSGTYHLIGKGDLSPRSQAILDKANEHIEAAYITEYDLEQGAFIRSIDPSKLRSVLDKAANLVDENPC